MRTLLFVFIICFCILSQGSGQVTISGTLRSMTDQYLVIERNNQLYTIERKAVMKQQSNSIQRTEVPISITVPFEAIESVRSIKPKKKLKN